MDEQIAHGPTTAGGLSVDSRYEEISCRSAGPLPRPTVAPIGTPNAAVVLPMRLRAESVLLPIRNGAVSAAVAAFDATAAGAMFILAIVIYWLLITTIMSRLDPAIIVRCVSSVRIAIG